MVGMDYKELNQLCNPSKHFLMQLRCEWAKEQEPRTLLF